MNDLVDAIKNALGAMLVVVCVGAVLFGIFLAIHDTVTLDPLPDGVKQRGSSFIVPPDALNDSHAQPSQLCDRLTGDDGPISSDWGVDSVSSVGATTYVKCKYDPD